MLISCNAGNSLLVFICNRAGSWHLLAEDREMRLLIRWSGPCAKRMHICFQKDATARIEVIMLLAKALSVLDARHSDHATILVAYTSDWRARENLVLVRTFYILHNGSRHKSFGHISEDHSAPDSTLILRLHTPGVVNQLWFL